MAPSFPPIYLLHYNFETDPQELHRLEREIGVVWDIREAELVLGKVTFKGRAKLEIEKVLKKLGLDIEEVLGEEKVGSGVESTRTLRQSAQKRRKLDATAVDGKEVILLSSDTDSGPEVGGGSIRRKKATSPGSATVSSKNRPAVPREQIISSTHRENRPLPGRIIKVLKLAWYSDSQEAGRLLPLKKYLLFKGRVIKPPKIKPSPKDTILPPNPGPSIIARAKADSPPPSTHHSSYQHKAQESRSKENRPSSQISRLHHETTSEHEAASHLPPLPEYLKGSYCCQRPTPLHCPNEEFLSQLRIIQKGRLLRGEEDWKIRSYAAALASIAAYPYIITSQAEVMRLPNIGPKMGLVWQQWKDTRHIDEVDEIEADPAMHSLNIFYNIHGVGAATARNFYNNGWRELDDVIEYGWEKLNREQQVGVKYYDEFLQRISRDEVEEIAGIIIDHANAIRTGYQMVICGGYRRGKPLCGDVDVIISHPDEAATKDFINVLCQALLDSGYLTHLLRLQTRNSDRDQETVSWKGARRNAGSGFDTLDHAFITWQDPNWEGMREALEKDSNAKNPRVHRRVDIIIAPWKTAGCAVVGWSGGTMFERDLRRYCREAREPKVKFDSSGVRRLSDGSWVDLEAGEGDLLVKEKRVFEGLGLDWIDPTFRNTD